MQQTATLPVVKQYPQGYTSKVKDLFNDALSDIDDELSRKV